MSRSFTSPLHESSKMQKTQTYYIVKDDFITNLRKGRKYKVNTQPVEQRQPSFIRDSCIIISKKTEIQKKLPLKGNNDFYQLDKQIENNRRSLYRKMTVAMRRERSAYQGRLNNPFSNATSDRKQSKSNFNQEKNLSDLIYYVQPYWIKKYISKNPQDSRPL